MATAPKCSQAQQLRPATQHQQRRAPACRSQRGAKRHGDGERHGRPGLRNSKTDNVGSLAGTGNISLTTADNNRRHDQRRRQQRRARPTAARCRGWGAALAKVRQWHVDSHRRNCSSGATSIMAGTLQLCRSDDAHCPSRASTARSGRRSPPTPGPSSTAAATATMEPCPGCRGNLCRRPLRPGDPNQRPVCHRPRQPELR